ncbi:response regulator transcription factor [Burkholderia sp. Ac-20365]|uniref:winged helix-turn-helix transcriptional regulator n=1 Tax=Burkholderia sp. Ac-20365 TaxID=2703897 RepID=UPI00197B5E68|nr:response regulator transcription factor [Burkholderia sp. Ac-20365]MBN3767841.1 response regulator transcription factor [Burkholderia sp. Ac-20365]
MRIAFFTQRDVLFNQISQKFEQVNISCTRFTNELAMIRFLQRNSASLVIFDATQIQISALATLTWRTCHFRTDVPLMMIGRSWDNAAIIEALEAGVDEIAVATASVEEITARAWRTLVRRGRLRVAERLTVGGYTIDRATRMLSFGEHHVSLTARELSLAWLLLKNAGTLMTRQQLANAVWGKDADLAGRSLEQHIYKLRSKLALDVRRGAQLKTIYSLGYVFVTDSHTVSEYRHPLASMAA